jgi:hypothetical protein
MLWALLRASWVRLPDLALATLLLRWLERWALAQPSLMPLMTARSELATLVAAALVMEMAE